MVGESTGCGIITVGISRGQVPVLPPADFTPPPTDSAPPLGRRFFRPHSVISTSRILSPHFAKSGGSFRIAEVPPHFAKSGGSRRRMVCGIIGGEKEILMGLVKTRRLAAMRKQQRAKAGMKPPKISVPGKRVRQQGLDWRQPGKQP